MLKNAKYLRKKLRGHLDVFGWERHLEPEELRTLAKYRQTLAEHYHEFEEELLARSKVDIYRASKLGEYIKWYEEESDDPNRVNALAHLHEELEGYPFTLPDDDDLVELGHYAAEDLENDYWDYSRDILPALKRLHGEACFDEALTQVRIAHEVIQRHVKDVYLEWEKTNGTNYQVLRTKLTNYKEDEHTGISPLHSLEENAMLFLKHFDLVDLAMVVDSLISEAGENRVRELQERQFNATHQDDTATDQIGYIETNTNDEIVSQWEYSRNFLPALKKRDVACYDGALTCVRIARKVAAGEASDVYLEWEKTNKFGDQLVHRTNLYFIDDDIDDPMFPPQLLLEEHMDIFLENMDLLSIANYCHFRNG